MIGPWWCREKETPGPIGQCSSEVYRVPQDSAASISDPNPPLRTFVMLSTRQWFTPPVSIGARIFETGIVWVAGFLFHGGSKYGVRSTRLSMTSPVPKEYGEWKPSRTSTQHGSLSRGRHPAVKEAWTRHGLTDSCEDLQGHTLQGGVADPRAWLMTWSATELTGTARSDLSILHWPA